MKLKSSLISLAICISSTQVIAGDLTAQELRLLLAANGVNPGTSVRLESGLQRLTSVRVDYGRHKGDFIVRLHIAGSKGGN